VEHLHLSEALVESLVDLLKRLDFLLLLPQLFEQLVQIERFKYFRVLHLIGELLVLLALRLLVAL
jgi:hypothetical protein